MRLKLNSLKLEGFKSIKSMDESIQFGDINLLIGANGAGKSNFISFFSMLNFITTQNLQEYVGRQGFADSLLYNGSKQTESIKAEIRFDGENNCQDLYGFRLTYSKSGNLFFADEYVEYFNPKHNKPFKKNFAYGKPESSLKENLDQNKTIEIIYYALSNLRVYQFHDTSEKSDIRQRSYINDYSYLRHNGGNLAAFLYLMKNKQEWKKYYERIVSHIRRIFPQFDDFILEPEELNNEYIRLDYKEINNDYRFGPHQLSDGSLRFMALSTLLLQPPDKLPATIILDEPELGLHPDAISDFAHMVNIASKNSQIILAAQSTRMVDEFSPGSIIIVERDKKKQCSKFKRLNKDELLDWLNEYSMSEIWEKNVIGGQP